MLTLLPDIGDLLRLQPQLNAGTIVELLHTLASPDKLWWASGYDPDHPLRDALSAAGFQLQEVLVERKETAFEHEKLLTFLSQYPQGRERIKQARSAEQTFASFLAIPLSIQRAFSPQMFEVAGNYHRAIREALGEGPGTRWRAKRLSDIAAALKGQIGSVIVPLDDLPDLLTLMPDTTLPDVADFHPGELSRLRALADRAWQLNESDDLQALLDALERESGDFITPRAELDVLTAGIYLAIGDLSSALLYLERAAHALTDTMPPSLPGLVLARLGQVRDALGKRDLAVRTYQAVLALTYIPMVAYEVALAGLREPFSLDIEHI